MNYVSTTLAHEIADAIVNRDGYADDPLIAEQRSREREEIEDIVTETLRTELRDRMVTQ